MRCPNCGKRYISEEIAVRGFIDQTYFLHLDCSNCHIPVFATIAISGELNKKIRETNNSELHKIEKTAFPKTDPDSPICDQDIKEFSQFIDNFDGSFAQLL